MKKNLYKLALIDMILLGISLILVLFSTWFSMWLSVRRFILLFNTFWAYRFVPIFIHLIPLVLALLHIFVILRITKDDNGSQRADIINNARTNTGRNEENI